MTPKKLARTLEALQQLFASQATRDPRFQAAAQSIAETAQTLQTEKPTLQIVSSNLEVAQAFYRWVGSGAAEFGNTRVSTPDQLGAVQHQSTPTLVLQSPDEATRYQPTQQDAVMIGRCPDCDVVIPDRYGLVSGRHAKLVPLHQPGATEWQLWDCSRNGTYVNAKPVSESRILQEGDRITLGLPYPTETCPEIIFERPFFSREQQEWINPWTNCDVLCLLTQLQAFDYRQLNDRLQQMPWASGIVLVEAALNQASASRIKEKVASELGDARFEIFGLPSFFLNGETPLPDEQKELSRFCKYLKDLTNSEAKKRLINRLVSRTLFCLSWADSTLAMQVQALEAIAQQSAQETNSLAAPKSKEEVNKLWKQLSDQTKSTFNLCREKLKQSRADLVDDYLENSLSNKIRSFVQNLRLCVFKSDGQKFIQLKLFINSAIVGSVSEEVQEVQVSDRPRTAKTSRVLRKRIFKRRQIKLNKIAAVGRERAVDANTALLNFCRFELSCWMEAEWEQIWSTYAQGGLKKCLAKVDEAVEAVSGSEPALSLAALPAEQAIDYESIFDEAFAKAACESRYQEPSAVVYLLKKVRSQWMQFIFMFSLLSVLGIASRRQIMQHITAPIIAAFQRSPWVSTAVLLLVFFYIAKLLIKLYRQDRDAEREKEAKKLRDGLCSYYQSLVKNRLLEKLWNCLNAALDAEEKKLQAAIDLLKQERTAAVQSQSSLSSYINQSEALQKEIYSRRAKLQDLGKTLL